MQEAERGNDIFHGLHRWSCRRAAHARRRVPSWMRVVTRVTMETGRASEPSTVSGGLRCLPVLTDEGAHRSARMPLSQSEQRRRISPSWRSTCLRPPRVGAGRTRAGSVKRSVHDLISLCATVSAKAVIKHLDQVSRAPLGTDVRTSLSLVKTSSARGRDESEATSDRVVNERKQEGSGH